MYMTQRESAALDRHITGNYGEDQFADENEGPDICGAPLPFDAENGVDSDAYCINAFPCKEHPLKGS